MEQAITRVPNCWVQDADGLTHFQWQERESANWENAEPELDVVLAYPGEAQFELVHCGACPGGVSRRGQPHCCRCCWRGHCHNLAAFPAACNGAHQIGWTAPCHGS